MRKGTTQVYACLSLLIYDSPVGVTPLVVVINLNLMGYVIIFTLHLKRGKLNVIKYHKRVTDFIRYMLGADKLRKGF